MFFSLNGIKLKRWFVVIFVLAAFTATVVLAVWLSLSFNSQGQSKVSIGEYSLEFCDENLNNDFFEQFDLTALSLVDSREVLLPQKDDAVFLEYISSQREQGFDLQKNCGKNVAQYIYKLADTQQSEAKYAVLLVNDKKVIAAHITDFVYGNSIQPFVNLK